MKIQFLANRKCILVNNNPIISLKNKLRSDLDQEIRSKSHYSNPFSYDLLQTFLKFILDFKNNFVSKQHLVVDLKNFQRDMTTNNLKDVN